MVNEINVLSLFDGMSCGQLALQRAGIKVNKYFASEIEKNTIAITKYNFPNTIQLGDVSKITKDSLPKIDLVLGGSPCQGFSKAGHKLGLQDSRSALFFHFVRLVKELNPKYFLLENVSMSKNNRDIVTNNMGVKPLTINSKLVSAQNRMRLYWTNIPGAVVPEDRGIYLNSIVGEYDGIWVIPRGVNKGGLKSYNGKSPTITTSSWQYNFFIYKNGEKIKFTENDCEQLQTVPLNYTKVDGVSSTARYKALGNGWTVDVITSILENIKKDGN